MLVIFADHWYYNSIGRRVRTVCLQWLPSVPIGEVLLSTSFLHCDWDHHLPGRFPRILWSLHGELHCDHDGKYLLSIHHIDGRGNLLSHCLHTDSRLIIDDIN